VEYNKDDKVEQDEKLSDLWTKRQGKKTSLMNRCEEYSRWTLPYVFPVDGGENNELASATDSTGARAVNHLANKLIMTLYAPYQPFFRMLVRDDFTDELAQAAKDGDPDAQEILDNLDKNLAKIEKEAMLELDYTKYRTEATMAAKSLIITGNTLMYHPENKTGRVQNYSLKDYCVVRDLSGVVVEILTRDMKALFTFAPEVRELLKAGKKKDGKDYTDDCDVTLYTRLKLHDDGKFHLTQHADDIPLDSKGVWPRDELPWIPLTWNLVRGEDYGRGLVEDYAGAFHSLYILNNALTTAVGIAADIKFLVDPTSMVDVAALNSAESGTYHSGKKDDVTAIQLDKQMDLAMVESAVERLTRSIAQAFLLNSAMTRDAERVTAEEIRYVVQELELSHGGIYSRFADEWQAPTARLMLKRVNVNIGNGMTIYPQIITGLDSLSRAGDLDNLRQMMQDASMLNNLPEGILAAIDNTRFLQFIGVRRAVDYDKFLKTADQMQAEAQAQMDAQSQMVQQEAGVGVAAKAAEQAMKEE